MKYTARGKKRREKGKLESIKSTTLLLLAGRSRCQKTNNKPKKFREKEKKTQV